MRKSRSDPETVVLYRPVGQKELDLLERSGFRAFPARLFHQPIFYPVLNKDYAVQIARDWNVNDPASGFVGYVTRFRVRSDFLRNYEIKTVGSKAIHQEYWIPAEEIDNFNANIVGLIEVIEKFSRSA